MTLKSPPRESQIELLRIILMQIIIIHHFIVHGGHLVEIESLPPSFGTYQKLIFESFVLFPVNCFIFISGYYKIKFRVEKVLSLWIQGFTYSVLIVIVISLAVPDVFNIRTLRASFFPVTSGIWWFLTCYFFLMLLSPGINWLADSMSKRQYQYIVGVFVVMICGVNFVHPYEPLAGNGSSLITFIFIYLLGRYFRLHRPSLFSSGNVKLRALSVYVACSIIISSSTLFLFVFLHGHYIWRIYSFGNILIVAQAVSVFFLFKELKISTSMFNHFAGTVFATYLIHDHPLVRKYLYSNGFFAERFSETDYYIVVIVGSALSILIAGGLLETARVLLTRPVLRVLNKTKPIQFLKTFEDELSATH